jgi:hypothetical protein
MKIEQTENIILTSECKYGLRQELLYQNKNYWIRLIRNSNQSTPRLPWGPRPKQRECSADPIRKRSRNMMQLRLMLPPLL